MQSIIILLLAVLVLSSALRFPSSIQRLSSSRNMFGGGKKAAITIQADGKTITCAGPVNLRKELQANKIDVYTLKTKLTGNCGGAGICGTCAVKMISGAENLNPPSKNEQNTLQGKPADFRLSCCAKVNGPIVIKTKVA